MSAGLTRLIRPLALMTLIKNLGRHTIYLSKLYNWYPLTISLNTPRHNPLHVISLSFISHVNIRQAMSTSTKPYIYVFVDFL
jgi:hypothetical protein